MEGFLIYLIKATIGLTLFAVFFRLLLIRETFFRFTRIVLILGLIIFSLLPLVKINTANPGIISQSFKNMEEKLLIHDADLFGGSSAEPAIIVANESTQSDGLPAVSELQVFYPELLPSTAIRWIDMLVIIYFGGVIFMLVRLAISLFRVSQIIKRGRVERMNGFKLVVTDDEIIPFSFFRYIVISSIDYNENPREIILHEKMHIFKKHNIDIVISELILAIHWFNPMMWMLSRDLREIHEYEADDAVINSGVEAQKYQLLLVKKAVGERRFTSVVNSFNHSKIKNRITMMLKTESTPLARFKVLCIVPLAVVMLLAFAAPDIEDQSQDVVNNRYSQSVVDQVQSNPLFYWEQLQSYSFDMGVSINELKEYIKSKESEQSVIILINSNNQILYRNSKSTEKIMNQEEVNSIFSVYKLKSMIVEAAKHDSALPVCFGVLNDRTSSSHVIFNFLSKTLPEAYEMAIDEISHRDNKSVEQLRQEMPLLLMHDIPRSYNENKLTDNNDREGDGIWYKIFFVQSAGLSKMNNKSESAIVHIDADMKYTDIKGIRGYLEDKLEIGRVIFLPTEYAH